MRTYTAILLKESGGYVAEVPALPGCFTQGDTYHETLANVREVIELTLEDMVVSGEALPEDIKIERVTVAEPARA